MVRTGTLGRLTRKREEFFPQIDRAHLTMCFGRSCSQHPAKPATTGCQRAAITATRGSG